MTKACPNKSQCIYFVILVLISTWLGGLHWVINPYKLTLWVQSGDSGHISIKSQCDDRESFSTVIEKPVSAGYFQYDFSLPKCQLNEITISRVGKPDNAQSITSATISYYGKETYRLLGSKRTLEGEGIFSRDSRPDRVAAVDLNSPLVIRTNRLDTSRVEIEWPRYLPLFLLPLLWPLSGKLSKFNFSPPTNPGGINIPIYLAVAAISLIAAMSVVSRTDVSVHPDELTHVASARYYYDHWLKPKIGSPETLDAHKTNIYGVAYLTGTDPVYQLAGKFAVIVWPVFENDVLALRAFNVTLFILLALLALKFNDIRLAIIPILATPQAWYIFSYFNGEAFPLFLSILAVVAFLGLSKPGHTTNTPPRLLRAFIAGGLAGFILLSKQNYWVVFGVISLLVIAQSNCLKKSQLSLMAIGWILALLGVFLIADKTIDLPAIATFLPVTIGVGLLIWASTILLYRIVKQYKTGSPRIRLVAVALLGLITVVGIKMVDESWHNPLPYTAARSEANKVVREVAAMPSHKPSAATEGQLGKTHKIREQGIGLSEMLLEKTWVKTSVTSFFGVYGYMNIWPTKHFSYALLLMFTLLTVIIFILASRRKPGTIDYSVPISLTTGFVTIVAASIGFSWTYDYQAQGKYLLPILPILAGGLVLIGQRAFQNKPFLWIVSGGFLLSATSFLLIGIRLIPKPPGIY